MGFRGSGVQIPASRPCVLNKKEGLADKLMAYAATGVSSCHEPITDQEALERLRLGMYVMVREGSIREDLIPISRILESGVDLGRMILVTDGISPKDLLEKGYIANAVNKIHSMQGGVVVSAGGKIVAEIPAPIFGLVSEMPVPSLVKQLKGITAAMKNLGSPLKDPLRTLVTLTGAAIPFLRICEQGYVDIKSGKVLGMMVY